MLISYDKVNAMLISIFLLFSCLHLIASDNHPASSRKRPVHDPVSNFFSELGDLFLDVDRTFSVQTAPKVEHEENLVTQILKPTTEYFDRIQKNYRNMQKRLGRLIGNTIGHKNAYSDHELSTVSPPHILAEKQIFTTSAPDVLKSNHNPFAAADKERERLSKRYTGRRGDFSDSIKAEEVYSTQSPDVIECSKEVLSDPVLERIRQEKCSRAAVKQAGEDFANVLLDPIRASQILFPLQAKEFDSISKDVRGILGRMGDLPSTEERTKIRLGSSDCSNEVLTDPVLELTRQEKCLNVPGGQPGKDSSILNRKQAAQILFPGQADLEKLSREFIKRLGDTLSEESQIASDDECLNEVSDPVLESIRKDKCTRIDAERQQRERMKEAILNPELAREIIFPLLKSDFPKGLLKRQGNLIESESSIVGGSFSESLFDKRLRQMLTDHSRWLLDNPLLNRWRLSSQTESSTEVSPTESTDSSENPSEDSTETVPTESYLPTSTEYKIVVSKSGESPAESHYYKVVNDDGVEEEVEIVFKHHENEAEAKEEQELKDSVILAFTMDGVPLKLRMGPEVENPLGYLHKALKSAGVSLNVPIESYDDLEPVGKEVLKLGTGLLSRAIYIDVSNSNELKTLLKTLMKFKASEK